VLISEKNFGRAANVFVFDPSLIQSNNKTRLHVPLRLPCVEWGHGKFHTKRQPESLLHHGGADGGRREITINTKYIMKMKIILFALALGASTCLIIAQDANQHPDGQSPPPSEGGPGGPDGPDGQGGGSHRPSGGFHLLPPRAQERLKLTADQQKQVADLEAEVKTKLEKILTPEQMQQLKQMRPPRPPGGQGGGQGGPGGEGRPQRPPGE
jgi:hypothetical protein